VTRVTQALAPRVASSIALLRDKATLGVVGNFGNLAVTLIIQVVQVPIFLHAVGVVRYSGWVFLTAIPAYFALSDLGFSGAAVTAATHQLAAQRTARAVEFIRSGWVLVNSVFGVLFILVIVALTLCNPRTFDTLRWSSICAIVILQLVGVVAWLQAGFIEGAFRASGEYPIGISLITLLRLGEFVCTMIVLLTTTSLVAAAAASAVTRCVFMWAIYVKARRRYSWYSLGIPHASLSAIRALAGPSLGSGGFSFGFGTINQGFVILAGSTLGPQNLIELTTVRTLANTIQQLTVSTSTGILGELTIAISKGEYLRASRLVLRSAMFVISIDVLSAAALALFGPEVIQVWTNGHVHPSRNFVVAMVLTVLADVPWQCCLAVVRSVNAQRRLGLLYLFAAILSVAIGGILLRMIGLIGVPLALFCLDAILTPVALVDARRILAGSLPHSSTLVAGVE
jgi:O-antigen/teichoic acid export membrane protein